MLIAIAVVYAVLLALLTCFSVAAVAEFRTGRRDNRFPLRILEIAVGVIATCALPSHFWGWTGLSDFTLSWIIVWVLLGASSLALLSKYGSRSALMLVLLGNGVLTFLWYYNGAYHNVGDDRTANIHWAYEWDTENPVDQILEKYRPNEVTKHGAIFFPPVYSQEVIYLLRPHSYTDPRGMSLVALNRDLLWEIRPIGGICTQPAVADDGTILFGTAATDGEQRQVAALGLYSGQGLVWAVSPNGKKKWTYDFPPATFLAARDAGGGSVLPAKSPACTQPAVAANGDTYWLGHGVYAITRDGAPRWTFNPGKDFYSVSIATDGTVYTLANGALFALAGDGQQVWKYSFDESKYFSGTLAIGPDATVYLTIPSPGMKSVLIALAPQGTVKWRNESYQLMGAPLVAPDGTIYTNISVEVTHGGNQEAVVALGRDGKEKWMTPNGSSLLTIGSDGTLYVCFVRRLFAFNSRGSMEWKADLPTDPSIGPTKAVTLASDRRFYIGDSLGRLGTLEVSAGPATLGWPSQFHDGRNTARAGAH